MECARVLSKHRFPATIIFLTVAGEEQGLYRQRHFAKMAKARRLEHRSRVEQRHCGRRPHAGRYAAGSARGACLLRRNSDDGDERTRCKRIRALGEENDGTVAPAGALIVTDFGREYLTAEYFQPMLVLRHDRYSARRRPHLLQRAGLSRRCASRSSARTSIISTRTCAPRTASNTVICRSSWTTITPPTLRG